ncbi:MAG: hypothetical protein ACP5QH_06130 [Thermoplasmata archaeon]
MEEDLSTMNGIETILDEFSMEELYQYTTVLSVAKNVSYELTFVL